MAEEQGGEVEIPPEFEPVGTVNLRDGGIDVVLSIEHPDEWIEKYPDAFAEVQNEALGEVRRAFEIRESDLRRLLAEERGTTADGTEQPAGSSSPTRRRRPASRDHLTLTVEEAGEQLGISRALAYEAVRRGEIPSIKIGRRILIPKAALNRMLESANTAPDSDP